MVNTKIKRVLFITWDSPGARYLETLFLPIFTELARYGFSFHVLQFSWGRAERVAEVRAACEAAGIPYRHVKVWRIGGAVSALMSAVLGARSVSRAAGRWDIDILMPRSLMPAIATLSVRRRDRYKIVFDADGLPADESVDFCGRSPHRLSYRLLRDIEAEMLRSADRVLARTSDAVSTLIARAGAGTDNSKFYTVPNGVEASRFLEQNGFTQRSPNDEVFRVCFLGSFGDKYSPELMLDIVLGLKREVQSLEFKIYTPDTAAALESLGKSDLRDVDWVDVRTLAAEHVPEHLLECSLGLALIKPAFSTRAVIAIKIGEYLLSGLPVICNRGMGGIQDLPQNNVIYTGDVTDRSAIAEWIKRLQRMGRTQVAAECRRLGLGYFSLDVTVRSYAAGLEGI